MCFVGAGAVNFGGAEGPWNHSKRLEQQGGVDVIAIVDLDTNKAKAVLEQKKNGSHSSLYSSCVVYPDCTTALRECKFDVAFIGTLSRKVVFDAARYIFFCVCRNSTILSWCFYFST